MRLGILLIFTLFSTSVICQFTEDFEDGDLTNGPVWQGNLNHFTVNAEGTLQLLAPTAGESILYTNAIFPDSFTFEFKHTLDFSPSASNLSKVYFLLDQTDLSRANGYYLNFGENGSADAIKLYELTNGASALLATGQSGSIALNSNQIGIRIEYTSDKKLLLSADFGGTGAFVPQFEITKTLNIKANPFLLLDCIYTSTRTDKFFFDDFKIALFVPDVSPPSIGNVTLNDAGDKLLITFSEKVGADALQASKYTLMPADVVVSSVNFVTASQNSVELSFNKGITPNVSYSVQIASLVDTRGNTVLNLVTPSFQTYAKPSKGGLFISEILFDPLANGQDFIEVYNGSDQVINLKGLVIKNESNASAKTVTSDVLLAAKAYLAFCPDVVSLKSIYSPPSEANFHMLDIPAFNNSDGQAAIYYPADQLLDEFAYLEDFHNQLIDDTEGVSLERISFDRAFGDGNYASAASSVQFGTPGYQNSNFITGTPQDNNEFTLVSKRFSPDLDGYEDALLISYNLPESGYLLNLKIFDANGQFIKTVTNNELLGVSGFIKWDGTNDDGDIERMGVYLLVGTAHSLGGATIEINKSCILAAKL